jgi:hypothetical protein
MILIITAIRTSYLTFNVRVINGRETWPLTLREEPRQRVSRRLLTEGWKICIMGCLICGLQHKLQMIKSKGMEEVVSVTRRKEEELHTSLYLIGESEESSCKRSVGEWD